MGSMNISFIAQDASLQRDDNGNLIVIAQGVDEDMWRSAPDRFHEQIAANEAAAEREARIRAEAERIVDAQDEAAAQEQTNG